MLEAAPRELTQNPLRKIWMPCSNGLPQRPITQRRGKMQPDSRQKMFTAEDVRGGDSGRLFLKPRAFVTNIYIFCTAIQLIHIFIYLYLNTQTLQPHVCAFFNPLMLHHILLTFLSRVGLGMNLEKIKTPLLHCTVHMTEMDQFAQIPGVSAIVSGNKSSSSSSLCIGFAESMKLRLLQCL